MPFVSSSDASFEADKYLLETAYRVNGTVDESNKTIAFRNAMHAAFVSYQARADIESRSSILAREDAEPGTIFWAAQTNPNEVDYVSDGAES